MSSPASFGPAEPFASLFEDAAEATLTVDAAGRIGLVNRRLERLFHYSRHDLHGRSITLLLPGGFPAGGSAGSIGVPGTGLPRGPMQLVGRRKDGTEFAADGVVTELVTGGGPLWAVAIRDVTGEVGSNANAFAQASRELDAFASLAGHDLQESLRMISRYVDLLGRTYRAQFDEKGKRWIRYVTDGSERLGVLVQDLLGYSRVLTRGEPMEELRLEDALAAAVRDLAGPARETDAAVDAGELPAVIGDLAQLSLLFRNLVGNAIKFRRRGVHPRVGIRSERQGNEWVIRVEDNGIGFNPDQASRIFEPFSRLHTREDYPGTGLGLATCRRIVERHGGRIWAQAEPGRGATIFFTLPTGGRT